MQCPEYPADPSENEFSIVFLGLRFAKGRITFPSPERPAQCYFSPFWRRMRKWTHKTVHQNSDAPHCPYGFGQRQRRVSQNGTLNGQNDEKTIHRWDDNWHCFRATPPSPQTIPNMEPQFIAAATWHKAIFQPPKPSFSCQTSIWLVLIENNHPNWLMFFRGVDGVGIPPTSAFLCKEMQLLADDAGGGRVARCRTRGPLPSKRWARRVELKVRSIWIHGTLYDGYPLVN